MIRGQPVYFIAQKIVVAGRRHIPKAMRVLEEKAKRGRSEDPHRIVL